jgi:hypothetical protein
MYITKAEVNVFAPVTCEHGSESWFDGEYLFSWGATRIGPEGRRGKFHGQFSWAKLAWIPLFWKAQAASVVLRSGPAGCSAKNGPRDLLSALQFATELQTVELLNNTTEMVR